MFIGNCSPLDTRLNNRFELFNDLSVYAISLHFYLFSDFVAEESTKSDIGWSAILFIGLNVAVNMVPVLFGIFKQVKMVIVKYWRLLKAKWKKFQA